MDATKGIPGLSSIRPDPNPQLDAIVKAIETTIQEKLLEIVPVLEAAGLHAHVGPTSAEWAKDGDFFRQDEIRIRVQAKYRVCDEEHSEP